MPIKRSEFRKALIKRHQFIKKIRYFFDNLGLIEVSTPKLLKTFATDVFIDSLATTVNKDINKEKTLYLHTSPELEMKRLLAQGSGDIYQICSVFRDNEQGRRNFNEFIMLEYYRKDFDIFKLMDEITNLIKSLGFDTKVTKMSYSEVFFKYTNIDIINTSFKDLKKVASSYGLSTDFNWIADLQILLFTALCEPKLKKIPMCFIYNYPKAQSALAKVNDKVALRFELYIFGVEIANGYDELQDAKAYKNCFEDDIKKRKTLSKKMPKIDENFLLELEKPLPKCAGVAIGIDRLLCSF